MVSVDGPIVGVGVLIFSKDDEMLFGKRLPSGLYGNPGGKLELFESWEECGRREVLEETGLKINTSDLRLLKVINSVDRETNAHYVSVFFACSYPEEQRTVNCEPGKCKGWEWWSYGTMQSRKKELFLPIYDLQESHHEVFNMRHVRELLKA